MSSAVSIDLFTISPSEAPKVVIISSSPPSQAKPRPPATPPLCLAVTLSSAVARAPPPLLGPPPTTSLHSPSIPRRRPASLLVSISPKLQASAEPSAVTTRHHCLRPPRCQLPLDQTPPHLHAPYLTIHRNPRRVARLLHRIQMQRASGDRNSRGESRGLEERRSERRRPEEGRSERQGPKEGRSERRQRMGDPSSGNQRRGDPSSGGRADPSADDPALGGEGRLARGGEGKE